MRMFSLLAPLVSLSLLAAPGTTEMVLTSVDGFSIRGTLSLPDGAKKAPVVILVHQFGSDRSGWGPLMERLAIRGIGTLAMDLRGHGASTLKSGTEVTISTDFAASAKIVGFDQIPGDLALAAAWLRKQPGVDGRRLGLAGSSVGALSVILAAPAVKPVAILSLSPAGSSAFGEGVHEKLKNALIRGRASVLVLASQDDKESAENALSMKDLPGVAVNMKEGDEQGFEYLKDRAELMAIYFGEYLTYHRLGKIYPSSGLLFPNSSTVINDQTLAEKGTEPIK